ncbi:Transcriptional regulator, ArsR family / Methyltransferase fusion [Minicystis rosea]|nr:Transcriptional regulator, ArsR family / Methyltransferase fusion [Minicystis rosea]
MAATEDSDRLSPPRGDAGARWELYRLLADPVRPRLLALTSVEELGVGELAELLREGQPKVSRHAAALRDAGLLSARRQGTWTLLRLASGAKDDPVVADAVGAGIASCRADGTLDRIEEIIGRRDAETREFFARSGRPARVGPPAELSAYLAAFAPLLAHRRLAIDVGTGDGALLEVLAPVFEKVIALDRADAQLVLASERVRRRELGNVTLVRGEIDGPEVRAALAKVMGHAAEGGGADVVFASRVLHHAPVPARAVRALVELCRPPEPGDRGGAVVLLDYEAHEDQALREREADLWLGFEPRELKRLGKSAGLVDIHWQRLPAAWQGEGPDRHLAWQLLVGFRGDGDDAARGTKPRRS